jgi:transposase-like protein
LPYNPNPRLFRDSNLIRVDTPMTETESLTTNPTPSRPASYSPERADLILEALARGETLAAAAADIGLRLETVELWLVEVDEFAERYEALTGKRPVGRPSKYRAAFAAVALALCKRGATDFDLAQEFGVSTVTVWRWQVQHPEFGEALRVGKDMFDDRVERALAQRAVGYSFHTQKIMQHQGEPVIVDYVEHLPPDVGAAKLWLLNRRPDRWKERQEVENSGEIHVTIDAADANY